MNFASLGVDDPLGHRLGTWGVVCTRSRPKNKTPEVGVFSGLGGVTATCLQAVLLAGLFEPAASSVRWIKMQGKTGK